MALCEKMGYLDDLIWGPENILNVFKSNHGPQNEINALLTL